MCVCEGVWCVCVVCEGVWVGREQFQSLKVYLYSFTFLSSLYPLPFFFLPSSPFLSTGPSFLPSHPPSNPPC